MRFLGLIPARGGSKGVPRKHLRPLGGRPMIAWTIEAALASRRLSRVVVTTDDPEIAEVSRRHGADVPFLRPAELSGDTALLPDVIDHALAELKKSGAAFDWLMLLFPTCPFRRASHIDSAIDEVLADDHLFYGIGAGRTPHHPYRTVRLSGERAELYMPVEDLEWPEVYKVNQSITMHKLTGAPVSVGTPENWMYLHPSDLRPCRKLGVVMDEAAAIDVDEPLDYFRALVAHKHGLVEP